MAQASVHPAWVPRTTTPGSEMQALARFFYDCTWTGTVYANMQGPGSPEMQAIGSMRCRPIMDGLWLACDGFQDQYAAGTKLLTWQLHLVVGWDVAARAYRAVLVDNNGTAALLHGTIDGQRLVMTPVEPVPAAGQLAALRLIWDASDPGAVHWRNEASVNGSPWILIEDYIMEPIGASYRSVLS